MITRYSDEFSQKSSIHISLFVLNYYLFRIGTKKHEDQSIFFKYGGFILREDAWPVQPQRQLLETSYLAQYFE